MLHVSATITYLVFSLLIIKPILFPIFISSVTVSSIYSRNFPIFTMLSAYASNIFPSSRFNVSVRGIFLIILSSTILKRTGNIAFLYFNPSLIINEDDISLFNLTRLLVFVLHSCMMLINLVGKPRPLKIFHSLSLYILS